MQISWKFLFFLLPFLFSIGASNLKAVVQFPPVTTVDISLEIPESVMDSKAQTSQELHPSDVAILVKISDERGRIIWEKPVDSDVLDYIMNWQVDFQETVRKVRVVSYREWYRTVHEFVYKVLSGKAKKADYEKFGRTTTKVQFKISGMEALSLARVTVLRERKTKEVQLTNFKIIGKKDSKWVFFQRMEDNSIFPVLRENLLKMKSFAPSGNWAKWFQFIDCYSKKNVIVMSKFMPKVEQEIIQLSQLSNYSRRGRNWGKSRYRQGSKFRAIKTNVIKFSICAVATLFGGVIMDLATPIIYPFGESVILQKLEELDQAVNKFHVNFHKQKMQSFEDGLE